MYYSTQTPAPSRPFRPTYSTEHSDSTNVDWVRALLRKFFVYLDVLCFNRNEQPMIILWT
jgi:hypothetical protein